MQRPLRNYKGIAEQIAFMAEHGGQLYAVELDALLAIVPDEFRKMVQDSVDKYFDQGVYQEMLQNNSSEAIRRLVIEKVRLWMRGQGYTVRRRQDKN